MAHARVVMHSTVISTAASTRFTGFGQGYVRVDSNDETIRAIPFRIGGTASLMDVQIDANASSGTSSVTLHNQTTNASLTLTVSIGAGATGKFADLTHSDPITAGSRYDLQIVTGATGGMTFGIIAITFDAGGSNVMQKMVQGYDLFHSASGFFHWSGSIVNTNNDSATRAITGCAGTWKNLDLNIGSNARTTTSVYTSRINGANGTMTVSVGSGATGLFSDLIHVDSLGASDQVNWATTLNAGDVATIVTSFCASEFYPASGSTSYPIICSSDTGASQNFNVTTFYPISGDPVANASESTQQIQFRSGPITVSQYGVNIVTNTIATSSTAFRLRVNGANSAISVGVGAGVTGQLRNVASQVVLVSGDLVNHSVATPNTSGALNFGDIHFAAAPPGVSILMYADAGMTDLASFSRAGSHQSMGMALVP